jgi:hypothetical protein
VQYPQQQQQQDIMSVEQWENLALNVIEFITSVISMPVEIILRPWYGSRYFSVAVLFFAAVMMILLPAFSLMASGVVSMIPFAGRHQVIGLFNGFRLWRRMIHMELEKHSRFEGPPLPIFRIIPKSFWFIRIVMEPASVFVAATIGGNVFIFQSGLVTFLHVAALALLVKNFIGWYREWQFLRDAFDSAALAPVMNKFMQGEATDQELSEVHIASLPKNMPEEMRGPAIARIAQRFSIPFPGGNHAS